VNAAGAPVEWGKAVDPELLRGALEQDPAVRAVFIQATETSTGVLHPVREIAAIVSPRPETSWWWTGSPIWGRGTPWIIGAGRGGRRFAEGAHAPPGLVRGAERESLAFRPRIETPQILFSIS